MEYMVLIYECEHERAARNDPQRAETYMPLGPPTSRRWRSPGS